MKQTRMEVVGTLISLFFVIPIWLFLLYRILQAVNASELMWFLYWIYVPATLAAIIFARVFKE